MDVISIARAHELAREAGLDLVLVADKVTPPVVRIMNFGKLQYEQKKNLKSQKKNNAAQKVKEVKFHINIDKHDFDVKIKHALDFLEKGCRLKLTLAMRGREMARPEMAYELMNKVLDTLKDYGDADGTPKLLGRNISVNFNPKPGLAARKAAAAPEPAAD